MEFTIDELTALVLQYSRLAMQSRKAADEQIKAANEYDKLAQVYLEAGKRFRRVAEEEESKMNIRKIITNTSLGLLTIMALVIVLYAMPFALTKVIAQDAPLVTNTPAVTASINGQPVEATLEPVSIPPPVDTTVSVVNVILDKLMLLGLIVAVIALAFKAAGLVPRETFDSALDKGFGILGGLTQQTKTQVDDKFIELAKPIVTQWLHDELAKRDAAAEQAIKSAAAPLIVPPMAHTDFTPKV